MNILLIDDEKSFHHILNILAKQLDFNSFLCSDLNKAKNIIEEHFIDIALIDINLPTCSGDQIITFIKDHSPNTLCYLFTSDFSKRLSYEKMVDGYIEKDKLVIKLPEILKKIKK
ncbi:response regulator [Deferribacter autotrophicus]|uniref:Response regulator n=1 Tax=Deferribacter autotrophicus TaxID=500465 RepID=A0A5A8F4J3_9BACT|nr:response regulator [Deferribacter autotrophicus]KAA0258511.1 response regulator [Deferribacter autotrophicus]